MEKKELSKFIDHSPLRMEASESEIIRYCKEAIEHSFYAMVVFPYYIDVARECLKDTPVKLETVVGFPFGNELISIKALQARTYLEMGVDEIDMVMNISAFKSGKLDQVSQDIDAVLKEVRDHHALLKVILEIEVLTDEEIIQACKLVADSGADYVKTSVGLLRGSKPATVDRVKLMHDTVSPKGLKVKASGGIHSTEVFLAMVEAGASRVGTSKGIELLAGLKDSAQSTAYK